MKLNGQEAEEPLAKTQKTDTKKERSFEKPKKAKWKIQNPNSPNSTNKTLKSDQGRYCKGARHTMSGYLELDIRQKLEEDPSAEKCQNCNTPGHEENNCYFTSAITWKNVHWSGNSQKLKRRSLKPINKTEIQINQKQNSNNNPLQKIWKRHFLTNRRPTHRIQICKTAGSIIWKQ